MDRLGPAPAVPEGASSARFVAGGPLSAPLLRVRYLCASGSCNASIEMVTTSQLFAWIHARQAGWRLVFDRGEAVRMCPRCARLEP